MPQFPGPYTLGHIKRTTASHWTELPEYRDATRAIDAHLLDAAIEAGWCKTTVETDDAARSVAVRLIARLNMSPTEVDRLDAEEVIAMLRAETDSGSNSGSDDSDSDNEYLPAKTIREGRFDSHSKFKVWLNNHPEVRTRNPRTNRLEVHEIDFLRHYKPEKTAGEGGSDTSDEEGLVFDGAEDRLAELWKKKSKLHRD